MNFDNYLNCLRTKLPATGDLQVFYNFSSGEKDLLGTSADLLYNLKFPTGEHIKQASVNGVVTGVIESNLHPGFSIGKTDMPVTHAGYFSGVDLVQVGLKADYTGWSAVLDVTPNLCDYSIEDNLSRVLISTMDSRDSLSGFHVGINQSNRLYLETREANKISYLTVNKEVNKNSIINISQSDNELSIGVYDIEAESLERESLILPEFARSDKMYLGNFLNNTNTNYTGYEGSINNFALFDRSHSIGGENSKCQCMFTSGLETSTISYEIISPNITGFHEVTGYATGVTGYVEQYKTIIDGDGNTFVSSYQSGVTGLVSKGLETVFLTGDATVLSHNIHSTGVLYDDDKYGLYNRYFLNFNNGLESGENIEILSFSEPRIDIGLEPDSKNRINNKSGVRLYNYGLYRQSKIDPTIGVGFFGAPEANLSNTSAHVYDYTINNNDVATGFVTSENNIIYDTVNDNAICIDFSGHYDTHKFKTGTSSYFPTHAQFPQPPTPATDKGQVIITGILGRQVHYGHHIYYNGQKLIEGTDYHTGSSPYDDNGVTRFADALIISGGLPGFSANGMYWDSLDQKWWNSYSNVHAPGSIYTPEMCFVPKVSGEQPQKLFKNITGNIAGIPDPLSGFNEMIWVNGIRQKRDEGYKLGRECSLSKTFTFFGEKPFIFYNNNEDFLNFS